MVQGLCPARALGGRTGLNLIKNATAKGEDGQFLCGKSCFDMFPHAILRSKMRENQFRS